MAFLALRYVINNGSPAWEKMDKVIRLRLLYFKRGRTLLRIWFVAAVSRRIVYPILGIIIHIFAARKSKAHVSGPFSSYAVRSLHVIIMYLDVSHSAFIKKWRYFVMFVRKCHRTALTQSCWLAKPASAKRNLHRNVWTHDPNTGQYSRFNPKPFSMQSAKQIKHPPWGSNPRPQG